MQPLRRQLYSLGENLLLPVGRQRALKWRESSLLPEMVKETSWFHRLHLKDGERLCKEEEQRDVWLSIKWKYWGSHWQWKAVRPVRPANLLNCLHLARDSISQIPHSFPTLDCVRPFLGASNYLGSVNVANQHPNRNYHPAHWRNVCKSSVEAILWLKVKAVLARTPTKE